MACEIEKNCDKDTILELYLNTSYFGNGYYCVYDASKGYFGKEPKDINRNEASMLAGIPNAPSAYAPNKHLDLALQRQEQVLEKITQLRAKYSKSKDLKEAEKLNNGINQIIAVAEQYPELKASEQFLNLQKSLSKMESQLQAARRIYNNEVTAYNTTINTVPTNIIAKMFNFKEAELFTIEDYKKENIQVDLG